MTKYLFISLMLVGFAASSIAQEKISFSGEVRDSLGLPLEFANVLAIDTTTNKMAGFVVTNPEGFFKLSLQKGTTYKIQISFIGYLPFEKIFTPQESNTIPYGIVLETNVNQLDDVEV